MIIVEGPDKCGKTSLAQALSFALGWPALHFSQPKGDAIGEYRAALEDNPRPFIADRFHLGEFVYGPLYRATVPDAERMRRLEDDLISRGALLVLMYDSPTAVVERFQAHGESFARIDHVPRLLSDFEDAYRGSRLAKLRARWSLDEAEQRALVERVKRLVARVAG